MIDTRHISCQFEIGLVSATDIDQWDGGCKKTGKIEQNFEIFFSIKPILHITYELCQHLGSLRSLCKALETKTLGLEWYSMEQTKSICADLVFPIKLEPFVHQNYILAQNNLEISRCAMSWNETYFLTSITKPFNLCS